MVESIGGGASGHVARTVYRYHANRVMIPLSDAAFYWLLLSSTATTGGAS